MRQGLMRAALAASLYAVVGGAALAQGEVRVLNWSDYIDPKIIDEFTAETKIKVIYDTFDTNEIVEAKLLAGKSGYDIVVPTATFLSRQIKAGVFQPLDKSKIPNLSNMWPEVQKRVATYDPGNTYSVNYMWGTTGIGYNVAKVKERMGDAPLDSWKLVYDPAIAKRFADCGIHVLDSAEDLLPSVLRYLGKDPDSKNAADFEAAGAHLAKIRPYIRKFHSSEYINALANGDICIAVGYSGDIKQAASRAEEAGKGIDIRYAIPKEGAQMWFDQMAIPADAPNAANAHAFIDFMMRPEMIARASNVVAYANGNLASQKHVDPAILNDPSVYPSAEVLSRLFTVTSPDQRLQRTITRTWTRVKTGR